MKTIPTFEDFLKETHAKAYTGTADDMPDDFDRWLSEFQEQSWLIYGDRYGLKVKELLYGPVPDMTGEVL